MLYVLLFASAVVPALLLVWFFHARDTFPEPPRVLWTTFGLGCLSVVPAVALGMTIEPVLQTRDALSVAAFQAFVIAALCEEGAKLSVLLGYSFRRSEFDEPMDGIVYGAAASLGFAGLENILYVLDGGFAIAVVRGLLSVPGHATYGAVMGYYVGRARFDRENRWRLVGLGLLVGRAAPRVLRLPADVAGHGRVRGDDHDALVAVRPGERRDGRWLVLVLGLAAVIVGWTWSLRLVKRVRQATSRSSHRAAARARDRWPRQDRRPPRAAPRHPRPLIPRWRHQRCRPCPCTTATLNRVAAWVAVASGGLIGAAGAL